MCTWSAPASIAPDSSPRGTRFTALVFTALLAGAAAALPVPGAAQELVVHVTPAAPQAGRVKWQPIVLKKGFAAPASSQLATGFERELATLLTNATRADIAGIAAAAATRWHGWHEEFVINGKCTENTRSAPASTPSGAFTYVLECRNCRPRAC